ncbi:MAG: D-alanine--D-alanine ligase [Planctomycetaceae bacterium]|nr:D-alanine--D-alanine ligase [Planctomycetaceae bacterium]
MKSLKVLVPAGGDSAEREVSLESGQCVTAALRERGHAVDLIDPATCSLLTLNADRWDVALPMLHGTGGEDGVLQRELQQLGLPYVGSSPEASELTFDKQRTKQLLESHGLDVPPGTTLSDIPSSAESAVLLEKFGPVIVVKPCRQGSSVGVSIIRTSGDLAEAVRTALRFDSLCLLERFIAGREITVPVIDGDLFPVIEITSADWYDYSAKYSDPRTRYTVDPPDIPSQLTNIAGDACRFCKVSGIIRIDFRLDPDGRPWLLEVNTIPGMTSHSLVPMSAAARGLSLGQLCERALRQALSARDSSSTVRRASFSPLQTRRQCDEC